MSGRGRLVRCAITAAALLALTGCQWMKGNAGTVNSSFDYGEGVSFGVGSLDHVPGGYGTVTYTQAQRVYISPLPAFAHNYFTGPARCVAVDGLRATVVFETDTAASTTQFGPGPAAAYIVKVQQASPASPTDLWSAQPTSGDLSVCAPPTDSDVAAMVPDNQGGSFTVGSTVLPGEP